MLRGSCLCGGVKYEIDGTVGKITNCHCSLCRKMSGSAFSSGATIPASSFRFVAGEDLLKSGNLLRATSGFFAGVVARRFSNVRQRTLATFVFAWEPWIAIREFLRRSIYMSVPKLPWVEINDELPQTG